MTARHYALKPGVSFCRVDGRTLFLDLAADRYFCLSPASDKAFSRLIDGLPLAANHAAALGDLLRRGILLQSDQSVPIAACPALDTPVQSRLDLTARAGILDTMLAARCLLAAPVRLRARGLQRAINEIRTRKENRSMGSIANARQARVAAAFMRLRLVARERDNCLVRSIAIADRLLAIGARPDLIVAVKLRPFYAHAWVQCDGWLVNDRHEFVRSYTPILIA